MAIVTESLSLIEPKTTQSALSDIRSRVAIVFTGGTIAVTSDKKAGPIPALRGKEILERIPELAAYLPNVEIEVFDFATLPGPHISPEMMLTLADFVRAVSDHSDGVVITHGTDSMEESAYFLDVAIGDHVPVVFTGAMHHSLDVGWDGGRNLIDAVAVAASKEFIGEGVVVVMNGTIHSSTQVTKSHTTRTDTFVSPDLGPLGRVNVLACEAPTKLRASNSHMAIPVDDEVELPHVELLKTYAGMGDLFFRAAIDSGAKGIVVEAMGQGNVPPGVMNGIARACEMKIPVVITSRCFSGPVRPYYAYEGAGLELERIGCIFAPYLTGPKARIKLMLALAAGYSSEKIQEIFAAL
ncbi:MAG: asparaginase [Bacteroidota bacterium]|nr:asparaginase [Bacteroidota bacterium]MDP4229930.1 asparaginase [Bacteroidota bacterium]